MKGADEDDRALVGDLLRTRDERAVRELYRRHTPVLFAMAVRLTSSPAAAADAVQDTWLRAVEALPRFEWRSELRTWLTSILLNCLRESARVEARFDELDEDVVADDEAAPLIHDIEAIDLERALSALPNGGRQVLVLHDIEGFKHREISQLLGIDVGTSKSQLARARRRLRAALREGDEGRTTEGLQ